MFDGAEFSGRHAIVIGASVAGLLAARVLAENFDHVTLIDRDHLPEGPAIRKGVPQARHIHVLLARGNRLLEQFFPGFEDDLTAAGATRLDWAADCGWFNFGGWKPRFTSGITSCVGSRELLEWSIRRRVASHSNLNWLADWEVTELATDDQRERVTGVHMRPRSGQAPNSAGQPEAVLAADLVVNASGRDSRAAQWLKKLGYAAPQETRVNSFLGYATRCYERPRQWQADWKALVVSATPPQSSRGAVIVPLEGERWLVTLAGAARDYPPIDEAGFLEFTRSLPTPLLHQTIKTAQALTDIVGYRKTENLRRHYEQMPRFLEGFVALGDAVCAFNPVYGQGMTVAGLSAQALDGCLSEQRQRRGHGNLTGLAERFQKRLGRIVALPWLLATGEDLRYPTTEGGHLGQANRLLRPYLDRVLLSANTNPNAHRAFLQVVHLVRPPSALFAMNVLVPMLLQIVRRAQQRAPQLDHLPVDRSTL